MRYTVVVLSVIALVGLGVRAVDAGCDYCEVPCAVGGCCFNVSSVGAALNKAYVKKEDCLEVDAGSGSCGVKYGSLWSYCPIPTGSCGGNSAQACIS